MKEIEVAMPVMSWLQNDEWDCYPEVQTHSYGPRADIVATKKPVVWIIESKTSLSMELLGQAASWIGAVHFVSIAIPARRNSPEFVYDYCKWKGIGVLIVQQSGYVTEKLHPKLFRKSHADRLLKLLHPHMKKYIPGSASKVDGYSTPYRRTMDLVKLFIAKNPGCTIKDILSGEKYHYSSYATARSTIPNALINFEKCVEIKQDGKVRRYYLKEEIR